MTREEEQTIETTPKDEVIIAIGNALKNRREVKSHLDVIDNNAKALSLSVMSWHEPIVNEIREHVKALRELLK